MTPLHRILSDRIETTGPINMADYMAACLMDPEHGYYTKRTVFGSQGDFTTSPEISQIFGELIGLCLAQTWLDQGAPQEFALVELGPGRGTLLSDALRATSTVAGFRNAARLHLVETSQTLREVQKGTLSQYDIEWHDDLSTIPDLPLFLIANEFFDALPVRQMVPHGDSWKEWMVIADGDQLLLELSETVTSCPELDFRLEDTRDGDLVEYCPALDSYVKNIGAQINARGGAALLIDYGDWRSLGDTVQAMQDHTYTDPLKDPGLADITAHVDFEAITRATPSGFSRVTPQGIFLERLGITPRAEQLAKNLSGQALDDLIAAHRRLTHPHEMGNLFKAIALFPKNGQPPAGFET